MTTAFGRVALRGEQSTRATFHRLSRARACRVPFERLRACRLRLGSVCEGSSSAMDTGQRGLATAVTYELCPTRRANGNASASGAPRRDGTRAGTYCAGTYRAGTYCGQGKPPFVGPCSRRAAHELRRRFIHRVPTRTQRRLDERLGWLELRTPRGQDRSQSWARVPHHEPRRARGLSPTLRPPRNQRPHPLHRAYGGRVGCPWTR